MQLSVTGHHIDVTEALRNYVGKKLAKLERHFDHMTDIHCILTVEKLSHKAEATVHVGGGTIHADSIEDEHVRGDRHARRQARSSGQEAQGEADGPSREGSREGARALSRRGPRGETPASKARQLVRLVIISGLSGSGKSVALHAARRSRLLLHRQHPDALLRSFVDELLLRRDPAFENVGVGLDARNRRRSDIAEIPTLVKSCERTTVACEVVFLQTNDKVLLSRFSETRRKHPLTDESTSLAEAIEKERELLGPVINTAELVIDTTRHERLRSCASRSASASRRARPASCRS